MSTAPSARRRWVVEVLLQPRAPSLARVDSVPSQTRPCALAQSSSSPVPCSRVSGCPTCATATYQPPGYTPALTSPSPTTSWNTGTPTSTSSSPAMSTTAYFQKHGPLGLIPPVGQPRERPRPERPRRDRRQHLPHLPHRDGRRNPHVRLLVAFHEDRCPGHCLLDHDGSLPRQPASRSVG